MASKKSDKVSEQIKSNIVQYQKVFGSVEGKSVLSDLMLNNHVLLGTFDKDPMVMAFREGQRSVIMDILSKLNIDPIKFAKMYEESQGDSF